MSCAINEYGCNKARFLPSPPLSQKFVTLISATLQDAAMGTQGSQPHQLLLNKGVGRPDLERITLMGQIWSAAGLADEPLALQILESLQRIGPPLQKCPHSMTPLHAAQQGFTVMLDSGHELCMLLRRSANHQSSYATPQLQCNLLKQVRMGGMRSQ